MKKIKEMFHKKPSLFIALLALAAMLLPLLAQAGNWTIWTITGKGSRRNVVEFTIESLFDGASAALMPGVSNSNDLGTPTRFFNEVYSQNFAFGVTITTTTSPARAGLLGVNSALTVYLSTGTGPGAWVVVGSQS